MILVDTSVLVNYLKGQDDAKTLLFAEILDQEIPFGISPYTYQEVLQGARNEDEYQRLRIYLSTQTIHVLPGGLHSFEQAARMYFDLRRAGATVRSIIDVRIALTAVQHKLALLHNDRDFDQMAEFIDELRIWQGVL